VSGLIPNTEEYLADGKLSCPGCEELRARAEVAEAERDALVKVVAAMTPLAEYARQQGGKLLSPALRERVREAVEREFSEHYAEDDCAARR
jgi:hypothetical protein